MKREERAVFIKETLRVMRAEADKVPAIALKAQAIEETLAELERYRTLAKLQDDLLACYRIGKRPTSKLLDGLAEVRAAIAEGE